MFLLLLIPGSLWGFTFLATEIVIESIPPMTLGLGRSIIAGIPLIIALHVMGGRLPNSWSAWRPFIILGLLNNSIPLTLIGWGQLQITSGLATILVSLNPLFTLVIAHFFIEDEQLNQRKVIGISMGLLGVVVLVGPAVLGGLGNELWAQVAVIVGALSYAGASVYARLHLREQKNDSIWVSIVQLISSQYIASAVTLLPFVIWVERVFELEPSGRSIWALLALSWPLTLIPVIIYYYLINAAGSSYTSITVYLIPLVGIFAGIVFLGETLSINAIYAFVLIVGGIATVNGVDKLLFRRQAT